MDCKIIEQETRDAAIELLHLRRPMLNAPALLVVGCSSSEIAGGEIGRLSSPEIGIAVVKGALAAAEEMGCEVAFQCCEHLNRALIVERAYADRMGLQQVWVVPRPKAGGSLATAAWQLLREPCAVEEVRADAGLDIGSTLIGMHLRPVAVPVRLRVCKIGHASITAARCRPKLIGGERACYAQEDVSQNCE